MSLSIFTITTIEIKNKDQLLSGCCAAAAEAKWSTRCVGFFSTFDEAEKCVLENWNDIHESSYDYVVIEEIQEGLYNNCKGSNYFQRWYVWREVDSKYIRTSIPEFAENIINWGLG